MNDAARLFPSRFEEPAQSPGYQLWLASNRWQREIRQALLPLGLTHVQFVLLAVMGNWSATHIGPSSAEITQQEIADAAGIDKMMTSQVLRALEQKGLVQRARSAIDQRAILLTLTPEGQDLMARALQCVETADDAFFGVLGEDAQALSRLLSQLSESPGKRETGTD